MKERKGLFNLTVLMIAIIGMLCMFAQTAAAYTTVDDGGCKDCHTKSQLHDHDDPPGCLDCHASIGDTPVTSKCTVCHPRGDTGSEQLQTFHIEKYGDTVPVDSCYPCHESTPADTDSDGVPDDEDNCPNDFNAEQLDADTDSAGDVCDGTPGCGGCGDPVCEKTLTEKVEELLTHYYWNILGRAPDSGGLNYWTGEIMSLYSSGGDIKEGFISMAQAYFNSPEYLDRNRDDEEYVTDLYNTFFDRPPDSGGLNHWTNELAQGMSRSVVLDNFVYSTEFNDFMDELFFGTS